METIKESIKRWRLGEAFHLLGNYVFGCLFEIFGPEDIIRMMNTAAKLFDWNMDSDFMYSLKSESEEFQKQNNFNKKMLSQINIETRRALAHSALALEI